MRHPEVAPDVLLGVGALLLADDHDPPAVEPGEPGDHRLVVAEESVAVELDEVVGHGVDELERPRPAQVARELDARPDRVARVALGQRARACRRRLLGGRRTSSPTRSAIELRNDSGRKPGVSTSAARRDAGSRSRGGSAWSSPIELGAHLGAGDDAVDEAVREQELRALEADRAAPGRSCPPTRASRRSR